MKKVSFLLFLCCSAAFAGGPIFQHKDTFDQQEFENVYQSIKTASAGDRLGTITNGNACTGCIGEYVASELGFSSRVNSTGTGLAFDMTSITLTAGDWDVSSSVAFRAASATQTSAYGFTSALSGNDQTDFDGMKFDGLGGAAFTIDPSFTIKTRRYSVATTTTVYLKGYAVYTGGPAQAYGGISARRVR